MKLQILALTLLAANLVACSHKNSTTAEAAPGPAPYVSHHKAEDCPMISGIWDYAGATSQMRVQIGFYYTRLTVTRISGENELWLVDGLRTKHKGSQKTVAAFCQSGAVIVEIDSPDNTYEVLSFKADPTNANQMLMTNETVIGRMDEVTQTLLLQNQTPKVFSKIATAEGTPTPAP